MTGIRPAAKAAWAAIRASGSRAPIIVVGVWSANVPSVTAQALKDVDQALADAVTEFADPLGLTFCIPIYNAPGAPWVTHSGNNSGKATSSNVTMYVTNSDNTHPTEPGTRYVADRVAVGVLEKVLPYLP